MWFWGIFHEKSSPAKTQRVKYIKFLAVWQLDTLVHTIKTHCDPFHRVMTKYHQIAIMKLTWYPCILNFRTSEAKRWFNQASCTVRSLYEPFTTYESIAVVVALASSEIVRTQWDKPHGKMMKSPELSTAHSRCFSQLPPPQAASVSPPDICNPGTFPLQALFACTPVNFHPETSVVTEGEAGSKSTRQTVLVLRTATNTHA